jgi:uncharacterized tellurite resistance protein B-like protein
MATWEKLADDLKTDKTLAALVEGQIEAIIDLLMLTIHADKTVAFMEQAELDHLLHELPWIQDKRALIDAHIEAVVKEIKDLEGEEGYRAFIEGRAAALPSGEVRQKAYQMVLALVDADMEVHPQEKMVLEWLAEGLGIPESERVTLG